MGIQYIKYDRIIRSVMCYETRYELVMFVCEYLNNCSLRWISEIVNMGWPLAFTIPLHVFNGAFKEKTPTYRVNEEKGRYSKIQPKWVWIYWRFLLQISCDVWVIHCNGCDMNLLFCSISSDSCNARTNLMIIWVIPPVLMS